MNVSNIIQEVNYTVSPDVPHYVYIGAGVAIATICALGVVLNGGIVLLFCLSSKVRTPFNFILMNMILSEMFIAFYGLPVDIMASINYGWKLGKAMCWASGFILSTSGTVSIVTLAVLSLQRLLMIVDANKFKIRSFGTAYLIIASIWLYTCCITIPPFFGFGAYVPETSGLTCAPDWQSRRHLTYTVYWTISGFVGPLLVIVISSLLTLGSLRQQTWSVHSDAIKRMSAKRERKIGILVFWMNLAFMVCWMPYGVICFFYIFGGYVPPTVVVMPLIAAKTSVCWNPIIYVAMNSQFRGALNTVLKRQVTSTTMTARATSAYGRGSSKDFKSNTSNGDADGVNLKYKPKCHLNDNESSSNALQTTTTQLVRSTTFCASTESNHDQIKTLKKVHSWSAATNNMADLVIEGVKKAKKRTMMVTFADVHSRRTSQSPQVMSPPQEKNHMAALTITCKPNGTLKREFSSNLQHQEGIPQETFI